MDFDYWLKQSPDKPLFPDIEWSRPEQKSMAGRLGIIGGNKLGFTAVAESYQTALKNGIGEAKVLLPDILKKSFQNLFTDVVYGPSNISGGLNRESINEMRALGEWANSILLIGDSGRNSETAILYEEFIAKYDKQLIITRDAIDLLKNNVNDLVARENTILVVSFAQLQKIFQHVYYPKVLTFSMQLSNLVEALHKFTVTYPATILTFHKEFLVIASDGRVATMPCADPMRIWKGTTATNASIYSTWNPTKVFESIITSLIK